jgi:hypothetical protein
LAHYRKTGRERLREFLHFEFAPNPLLEPTGIHEESPILVLRSPSFIPKSGEFDYMRNLQPLSDRESHVTVKLVEGATHDFAQFHAKEAI